MCKSAHQKRIETCGQATPALFRTRVEVGIELAKQLG